MSYYGGGSWTGMLIVLFLIAGVCGWVVIEALRWVFSFIHISFG